MWRRELALLPGLTGPQTLGHMHIYTYAYTYRLTETPNTHAHLHAHTDMCT